MFEHVLVVVDGSPTAQYAVDASITIAREVQGEITYCISIDPDLFDEGSGVRGLAEMAMGSCSTILESAIAGARHAGIAKVCGRILRHDTVHGVIAAAHDRNSDLIMLGLEPKVGILRPFMRNLGEEILRHTTIPLCLVRRPARGRLARRLLVPLVHDELAELLIERALAIAVQFSATLILCRMQAAATAVDAVMERAVQAAALQHVAVEELVLDDAGGIPDAIAHLAEISVCDAVVMATHARTGWPRLISGSVSAAVTYASDVPVILVRAPLSDLGEI